jgi:hypothetical protein
MIDSSRKNTAPSFEDILASGTCIPRVSPCGEGDVWIRFWLTRSSLQTRRLCTLTPLQAYRTVRPPYLQTSIISISASSLQHSEPLYLHVATSSSILRISEPLGVHIATPSSILQTSRTLYLHVATSSSILHTSISPPEPRPSYLHVRTPTSRLRHPRPLYLYPLHRGHLALMSWQKFFGP